MARRKVSQAQFEQALAHLRDPSGDGSTKVSMRAMGDKVFYCLTCKLPTKTQNPGVSLGDVTKVCEC